MAASSYKLVMKTGPTPGKVIALDKPTMVVGRDLNCEIIINDAEISRKHTRFTLTAGGCTVEDLGSTNGTFVNGQRLMGPHALAAGETVMLGEHVELVVEAAAFDPNATMMGGPAHLEMPAIPKPEPVYSAGIPEGPSQYEAEEGEAVEPAAPEKPNKTRTWILAGCGCLFVLLCVCGAGGYYLYSSGFFNDILSSLGL
jgi:hypothetical protein